MKPALIKISSENAIWLTLLTPLRIDQNLRQCALAESSGDNANFTDDRQQYNLVKNQAIIQTGKARRQQSITRQNHNRQCETVNPSGNNAT